MKTNLLIAAFGLVLGLVLLGAAYPFVQMIRSQGGEATHFESVEDLQRSMLERDERDVKHDGSVSLRSIVTPHPADAIIYDLMPNLDVRFQRVPVSTNRCGMRGPETSIAKPAGTYRIALLGDSFAFGWGVEEPRIFARVMEQQLNDKFQGNPRIEVLNFGVPGYSTFQEVALFEERVLDFDPDAALVYFIDNDFGLPFFMKNFYQESSLIPAVQHARWVARGNDPELNRAHYAVNDLIDPNKALGHLGDLAGERGIPVVVTITPSKNIRQIKRRLPILKKHPQISYFNLNDSFMKIVEHRGIDLHDLQLKGDPHPNAKKHALLGEALAGHFFTLIESGRGTLERADDGSRRP